MDLFLDNIEELDKEFKKEAGFVSKLSDKADSWPAEINNDLFKTLPYLSDYEVAVNLDKVEPQRGYAFGFADVSNKTERPEVEHTEMGIPHIRIPIVVDERAVRPFSVFMDGERVYPMSEERLRESLFNPQTFDLSTSQPRDPSLVETLMPPQRSGIGMGGETKMASAKTSIGKKVLKGAKNFASGAATVATGGVIAGQINKNKTASLLRAIAPTMRESDVKAFVEKIASDHSIAAGFRRAGIGDLLVEVFEKTKRASASEKLETLANAIEPTVVTIQKLPGGDFLIKSAASNNFAGDKKAKGEVMPKEEAAEAIGPENAQAMQPGQTATAVSDPVEPQQPMVTKAKIVEVFGQYNVQDTMGNTLMGSVFPTVLSWDGSFTPEPMMLFTNGSSFAIQDSIAGEITGRNTVLPEDQPLGDGTFYVIEGGAATCTVPLTIGSAIAGPDGMPRYIGTDPFGNQIQVAIMPGLVQPERISDVEYALPPTWKFMRLNNQTQLGGDPSQFNKMAAVRQEANSVTLFYNGGYNLIGGCGLDKISSDFRYDLDTVSAEFMLGVLGVEGNIAKQKIAEARKNKSVKLAGLKTIKTLGESYSESVKTASALLSQLPNLKRDLVKEAATMNDEGTIDNILALNFINPENLSTFIGYLPELEETSEKLAEMALSSYLGMQELPEGAIERAMKNIEEVIQGLKALSHAEQ